MSSPNPSERALTHAAERIMDSATELFLDKGYAKTTLQEVASQAGVAKGLVSHHFGSKLQLLTVVLENYYDKQRAALTEAHDENDTPKERLRRLLVAYFDFACEHRRFPRLVQRVSESSEETRVLVEARLGRVYKLVEDLLLQITGPTGALAARQCYVSFSGLVVNYFLYANLLSVHWDDDPYSEAMLNERREHLLLIADLLFDAMAAQERA